MSAKLFSRHCHAVPVKAVGTAVNEKLVPGVTAAVGAPLIEAPPATGVAEEAPAVLPAPAAGAAAVRIASILVVGISSYVYQGENTGSVNSGVIAKLPLAFSIEQIRPPPVLSNGFDRLVNRFLSARTSELASAAMLLLGPE